MDDGWIERALHRVEMLEAERARRAGSGDPQAALRVIEIDAELEALVEALEAAADEAEAEAGIASAAIDGVPVPHGWGPAPGYTTIAEPLPQSEDTAPMRVAGDPSVTALDEPIDLPRRRYVWPAVAAAVAVLVLGVGAAVASGGGAFEDTAASRPAASLSAAVPAMVAAAEVPPDTQEPETARGADVDVTPPTVIPEAAPVAPAKTAVGPSRTSKKKKRHEKRRRAHGKTKKKKKKGSRGVAFDRSRDPLSGLE